MNGKPSESLEQFKARVEKLESHKPTSDLFLKIGWPSLVVGLMIALYNGFSDEKNFFIALVGGVMICVGAVSFILRYFSRQSEGLEISEREKRIRQRSKGAPCIHLEGNVPDGRGAIGHCRLYEFTMTDYPYCIHCREYSAKKGSPDLS